METRACLRCNVVNDVSDFTSGLKITKQCSQCRLKSRNWEAKNKKRKIELADSTKERYCSQCKKTKPLQSFKSYAVTCLKCNKGREFFSKTDLHLLFNDIVFSGCSVQDRIGVENTPITETTILREAPFIFNECLQLYHAGYSPSSDNTVNDLLDDENDNEEEDALNAQNLVPEDVVDQERLIDQLEGPPELDDEKSHREWELTMEKDADKHYEKFHKYIQNSHQLNTNELHYPVNEAISAPLVGDGTRGLLGYFLGDENVAGCQIIPSQDFMPRVVDGVSNPLDDTDQVLDSENRMLISNLMNHDLSASSQIRENIQDGESCRSSNSPDESMNMTSNLSEQSIDSSDILDIHMNKRMQAIVLEYLLNNVVESFRKIAKYNIVLTMENKTKTIRIGFKCQYFHSSTHSPHKELLNCEGRGECTYNIKKNLLKFRWIHRNHCMEANAYSSTRMLKKLVEQLYLKNNSLGPRFLKLHLESEHNIDVSINKANYLIRTATRKNWFRDKKSMIRSTLLFLQDFKGIELRCLLKTYVEIYGSKNPSQQLCTVGFIMEKYLRLVKQRGCKLFAMDSSYGTISMNWQLFGIFAILDDSALPVCMYWAEGSNRNLNLYYISQLKLGEDVKILADKDNAQISAIQLCGHTPFICKWHAEKAIARRMMESFEHCKLITYDDWTPDYIRNTGFGTSVVGDKHIFFRKPNKTEKEFLLYLIRHVAFARPELRKMYFPSTCINGIYDYLISVIFKFCYEYNLGGVWCYLYREWLQMSKIKMWTHAFSKEFMFVRTTMPVESIWSSIKISCLKKYHRPRMDYSAFYILNVYLSEKIDLWDQRLSKSYSLRNSLNTKRIMESWRKDLYLHFMRKAKKLAISGVTGNYEEIYKTSISPWGCDCREFYHDRRFLFCQHLVQKIQSLEGFPFKQADIFFRDLERVSQQPYYRHKLFNNVSDISDNFQADHESLDSDFMNGMDLASSEIDHREELAREDDNIRIENDRKILSLKNHVEEQLKFLDMLKSRKFNSAERIILDDLLKLKVRKLKDAIHLQNYKHKLLASMEKNAELTFVSSDPKISDAEHMILVKALHLFK